MSYPAVACFFASMQFPSPSVSQCAATPPPIALLFPTAATSPQPAEPRSGHVHVGPELLRVIIIHGQLPDPGSNPLTKLIAAGRGVANASRVSAMY